jgi:hypothetical protein
MPKSLIPKDRRRGGDEPAEGWADFTIGFPSCDFVSLVVEVS